ncbi:MAG: DUF3575 domain-containing protein [Bacteroidales bacterium]|nr:DUF3575 domain-containing protein [Bacteroidales bacterium]
MSIKKYGIALIFFMFSVFAAHSQEVRTGGDKDCCTDTLCTGQEKWTRKMTLKTNAIGWGFLMTNAALEIDIVKNLSFALPVYYSGWDYGVSTLKFRTLMIQPELRYYIPKAKGFYVGAHFGMGYWNFALNGDWRYQDHKGETPAIGGGLGLGYAMHFKKNSHWGLEFSVGAGAYDARYDVFYNEPNGPYHKRNERTTFIGVDNAAISLTYEFGLRSEEKAARKEMKKAEKKAEKELKKSEQEQKKTEKEEKKAAKDLKKSKTGKDRKDKKKKEGKR